MGLVTATAAAAAAATAGHTQAADQIENLARRSAIR
jgi:hypothetical protein